MKKVFILASLGQSFHNFRGQLILDFIAKGYEVHACAPELHEDKETHTWLNSRGVICHDAPFSRASINPAADVFALLKLRALIKKISPDVFFAYTIKPVIWGGIAARMARVPKRVALITGLGYAFTGEASGKRGVIQQLARNLYKLSLRGMQQIFFQNPDDKNDFEKLGVLPKNVSIDVVNGSGVDLERYEVSPLPNVPYKFLLVARLLGDKGIREYAKAAEQIKKIHPDVEFHLVGGLDPNPDGLKKSEIDNWTMQDILIWHGHQSDVRPYIKNCHVYVLPSYREGTPRTVLESMAMGRAIITTDAPGCRETVISNYNGYLVKVGSVDELAAAMLSFIENPDKIASMGKMSREIAQSKYDVHKVNEFMLSRILN